MLLSIQNPNRKHMPEFACLTPFPGGVRGAGARPSCADIDLARARAQWHDGFNLQHGCGAAAAADKALRRMRASLHEAARGRRQEHGRNRMPKMVHTF